MRSGSIKSITIEYDSGETETFYRKLNNLSMESLRINPRIVPGPKNGMYDTYESLIDFVTYTATFKWEVDNFENKGK